eukprot:4278221-Pleurochrysis_carterae.AAC.1
MPSTFEPFVRLNTPCDAITACSFAKSKSESKSCRAVASITCVQTPKDTHGLLTDREDRVPPGTLHGPIARGKEVEIHPARRDESKHRMTIDRHVLWPTGVLQDGLKPPPPRLSTRQRAFAIKV